MNFSVTFSRASYHSDQSCQRLLVGTIMQEQIRPHRNIRGFYIQNTKYMSNLSCNNILHMPIKIVQEHIILILTYDWDYMSLLMITKHGKHYQLHVVYHSTQSQVHYFFFFMKLFPVLFADDTNVFITGNHLQEMSIILNVELKMLSTWFKLKQLSLNKQLTVYPIQEYHNIG